jgi:hypothetical protein
MHISSLRQERARSGIAQSIVIPHRPFTQARTSVVTMRPGVRFWHFAAVSVGSEDDRY